MSSGCWRSQSTGEGSGAVLPSGLRRAVPVQHFVMVPSQASLEGAGADSAEDMREEAREATDPSSDALLLSCQTNGTRLLNLVQLSRQD